MSGRRAALLFALAGLGACDGCEDAPGTSTIGTDGLVALPVQRSEGPIALDGALDEPAWERAARTHAFVETMGGGAADFEVFARFTYDDEALYVAYEVEDALLASPFTAHDDHLWEQDCVELFVMEPAEGATGYYEVQVSPRGTAFDTHYTARRLPRPFGRVDWQSGVQSGVSLEGALDDTEADEGYVVEARVPFAALGRDAAPAAGETMRVNLYVMNRLARGMAAAAWSPPLVGDFHVPARFGALRFR
jgi:hypothetical protein